MLDQTSMAQEIAAAIGNPVTFNAELEEFKRSAKVFSSKREQMLAKYRKQWVATVDSKVVAHAASLQRLFMKVDALKIPREKAMIRYVDVTSRKLIL